MSYIVPAADYPDPTPVFQSMLAGVTGLPGNFVRPSWQSQPAKSPDISVNWLAFELTSLPADSMSYLGPNGLMTRTHVMTLEVSVYGPRGFTLVNNIVDGLELAQNREVLSANGIKYKAAGDIKKGPDLLNERWVNRFMVSLQFLVEARRSYSVLDFSSASGTINVDEPEISETFQVNE